MGTCLDCKKQISKNAKRCSACYHANGHIAGQGFQKGHGLIGGNPTSKGKNWKLTEENKKNQSLSKQGEKNPFYGKKILPQTQAALIKANIGNKYCVGLKPTKETIEKRRIAMSGSNHFRWIEDRTKLVKSEKKHPELRYEVNNGITLCAAHHPRKINDEERLIPTFRELVLTEK